MPCTARARRPRRLCRRRTSSRSTWRCGRPVLGRPRRRRDRPAAARARRGPRPRRSRPLWATSSACSALLDEDPGANRARRVPAASARCRPPSSSATTPSSGCCSSAAPIPTGPRARRAPRGRRCTRPRAPATGAGGAAARPRRRSQRHVDSSGSATYAARTPRAARSCCARAAGSTLRPGLAGRGRRGRAPRGRRSRARPTPAAAACSRRPARCGKRDLVVRLLAAGARVPPVVTAAGPTCWKTPSMLRAAARERHGPRPARTGSARPRCTTSAGATAAAGRARTGAECAAHPARRRRPISARDEEYRSTPLAWAARNDLPDMVELLLARGAPPASRTTSPGRRRWPGPRGGARAASPRSCARAGATA